MEFEPGTKEQSEIADVGVIGAGVIGRGVAQTAAQAGHHVVLVDTSAAVLDEALRDVRRGVLMLGLVGGQRDDPSQVLARITTTLDYAALRDAAIIVENVTESLDTKRESHERLAAVDAAPSVIGCNTSTIPIGHFVEWTPWPDRLVGMHFMNPVPLKPAVELVRARTTGDEALAAARSFLESLGKVAILVGDSPGFVSNRVFMLTINEAAHVVDENVASAEVVDRIFVECFGHPMGPLATADLIGVDTVVRSLEMLQELLGDRRFEPSPALVRLVDEGRLGRKSGEGFHRYES